MIYVLLAQLFFGFIHPGSKLLLNSGIGVLEFVWLFILIRWVAHLPLLFHKKSNVLGRPFQFKHHKLFFWIGVAGIGVQYFEFLAIQQGLPVPVISFLVGSFPIWMLACSYFINNVSPKPYQFVQSVLALVGVFFLTGLSSDVSLFKVNSKLFIAPLLASLFFALWISLATKARAQEISTWSLSFYYDLYALVGLTGAILFKSYGQPHYWTHLLNFQEILIPLVAFSLICGWLPNLLYYKGIQKLTPIAAGLAMLLEPVLATFYSHIIWPMPVASSFIIGAIFILLSQMPRIEGAIGKGFDFNRLIANTSLNRLYNRNKS